MDSYESNPSGGIIAVNPAITPLRWKLTAEPEMPSHGQMATNAASSLAKNLKSLAGGNKLKADPDEIERRKAICSTCEYFDRGRCAKCGCWLQYKAILRAESCPAGRWE